MTSLLTQFLVDRMNDLIGEKDDIIFRDFICAEEKDILLREVKRKFLLNATMYADAMDCEKVNVTTDELLNIYSRSERLH